MSVLIGNRKEDTDTRKEEGGCVKMEAETVVMKPQARVCQQHQKQGVYKPQTYISKCQNIYII